MSYQNFIESKRLTSAPCGFTVESSQLNPALFEFQRDIVLWALKRGRAAIFADCGLGKTPQQLEYGVQVHKHTDGDILICAPLAVGHQTKMLGAQFGYEVNICRAQKDVRRGLNITNYEMLEHFDARQFAGVILDESSVLKSQDSKTRKYITEAFADTPYKLTCTATPSPNDHMELGTHAEFLGVMSRVEMLAMFFTHDGGDTQKWRLKGHAESEFWKWICTWAVMVRKPSDLGYPDAGFALPPLNTIHRVVESNTDGRLFAIGAQALTERRAARKNSLSDRVQVAADLANSNDEPWLIWCDFNAEGDELEKAIPGAVQIAGSDSPNFKADAMMRFTRGEIRVLVTKPSIAGFGMNWQHCANMIFAGLSDSYEQYYQAVRRCWRFGQTRPVSCYVITSEAESTVVENIARKHASAEEMGNQMTQHTSKILTEVVHGISRETDTYLRATQRGNDWTAHLGDCVEVTSEMESSSVGYSVFSPPFASLYTYSNSERDMGNCKTHSEFYKHFQYLTKELLRVMMPGRLLSFHCMNLPASKERDGYIGISDFRGDLIRIFQESGFIYHSEVCIWKDPVTAMQRTKALGLLHKTIRKDSAMSRQGIADYLVTMRKPGDNPEPIAHTHDDFPVSLWQRYASPVWMDINPSRTLQRESAREEKDERHICPLQLDVIERALELWSKPGDLVYSPFMGIGSEGHCALKMNRLFVGTELKQSYWEQACKNLSATEVAKQQLSIFDVLTERETVAA